MPLLALAACFALATSSTAASDEQFDRFRRTADKSQLYEFFREMPKGGILHLHSEYAVTPGFWLKIAADASLVGDNEYFAKADDKPCPDASAKRILFGTVQRTTWNHLSTCEKGNFKRLNSLSPGERGAWLEAMRLTEPDRKKFFDGIVPRLDELCQDPNLMLEVIPKIMQDAASEHVTYLELQFDPTSLRDAARLPVPPDLFIERLKKRLLRSDAARTHVTVRFQLAAYRYAADPEKEIRNAFEFVHRHRDLWVGVNLLGEEGLPGGDLSRFAPVLRKMLSVYNIPLSLHAGELDSPGHQVRDAVAAGASRIGHALNLIEDPATMPSLRRARIPIETSLVSNKMLQYTPDLAAHPFPAYLRFGIPMCLNTDDPGAWDATLTDEFFLASTLYHLRWIEIARIAENSLRFAFADTSTRDGLLARLHRDLSAFEQRTFGTQLPPAAAQSESPFARKYLLN